MATPNNVTAAPQGRMRVPFVLDDGGRAALAALVGARPEYEATDSESYCPCCGSYDSLRAPALNAAIAATREALK